MLCISLLLYFELIKVSFVDEENNSAIIHWCSGVQCAYTAKAPDKRHAAAVAATQQRGQYSILPELLAGKP